jgi:hypothetical protein
VYRRQHFNLPQSLNRYRNHNYLREARLLSARNFTEPARLTLNGWTRSRRIQVTHSFNGKSLVA